MARVLIVERAGRGERLGHALRERGYAVRAIDTDPPLPGRVLDALEDVSVVCWLMALGEGLHPEVNAAQLEAVLLKVVDTGVRGFVFERPGDGNSPNPYVEHARATWHIPVAEVHVGGALADAAARGDGAAQDGWIAAVTAAVDTTLGAAR
jgi:hypothetical protein